MLPLTYFRFMKNGYQFILLLILTACQKDAGVPVLGTGTGTGGSTARFTTVADQLYVLSRQQLVTYDTRSGTNPVPTSTIDLGVSPETIFPFGDYLLLGTPTGMLIYDRSTDPGRPAYVSKYQHLSSCDPVVAQGRYAYATLSSGSPCRWGQNQLDVIDISDIKNPRVVRSISLTNPQGLGVDGAVLFVGEGDYGMRVFDITNPVFPKETLYLKDVKTYDVIPTQKVLVVTGLDGVYQYSYQNPTDLKLLSKLSVQP